LYSEYLNKIGKKESDHEGEVTNGIAEGKWPQRWGHKNYCSGKGDHESEVTNKCFEVQWPQK